MHKNTRVAIYAVVAVAIIGLLSYSIPQMFRQLQSSLLYGYNYNYTYNYQYEYAPGQYETRTEQIPVEMQINTTGTDQDPIAGTPTTYTLSLKNNHSTFPAIINAVTLKMALERSAGGSNFTLLSPSTPGNVQVFGEMEYENAQFTDTSGQPYRLEYLGYTGNPDGIQIPPGGEVTFFSWTGTYSAPILTTNVATLLTVEDAQFFFYNIPTTPSGTGSQQQVTLDTSGNILCGTTACAPSFSVQQQAVGFAIRSSQLDIDSDNRINENEIRKIFEEWKE